MFRIWRAVRFLFLGPVILLGLFAVNVLNWHGHWWVHRPAILIGLVWFLALFRVLRAAVLVGGVAALVTYLTRRKPTTP